MGVLDELLEQIDVDEAESHDAPAEWGDGVFEMSFCVAKALLLLAKAGLGMKEPLYVDDRMQRRECAICGAWATYHWGSCSNKPVEHEDWCVWKHVQEIGKRLN